MKTKFFIIPVLCLAALFVSACHIDIGPDTDTDADTEIDYYYARYVAIPPDGTDTDRYYKFWANKPHNIESFYFKGALDEVFGPFERGLQVGISLDDSERGAEPKFLIRVYVKKGESGQFALCADDYDSAFYTIESLDGE